MKFTCKCCGDELEDWPAIVYNSPSIYSYLNENELNNSELSSDFCIVNYAGETYRYIRVVLVQKVIGSCQNLDYGVWVSLSEKSFNEYVENYDNKKFEAGYFGWLSNYLPDYESTINIPINVFVNNSIGRPLIDPQQDYKHSFIEDFYNGITKEEAEKRINLVLKNNQ